MSNLTVDFPQSIKNLDDPVAQRQLLTFITSLTENLKSVLGDLDTGNFTDDVADKLNTMASVSEKAQKLADMLDKGDLAQTKDVRATYQALRDSVFSSMDNITASFDSLIEQAKNEITLYVEGNFIASDPDMTLEERISSMIQQTADQIRLEFNTQATVTSETVNALALDFSTYFRFSESGFEIGRIGDGASPIVMRLTSERLEFIVAGTDVVLAYLDGATNKLKINMAEIDQLSLGNNVSGYIDIDMTSEGLFFRWRA